MKWRTVRDESHFDTATSVIDEHGLVVAQAVNEEAARLIAAAPALLEAARELVRELGGFQNIIQCDSFNKLRAAIAAAGK